MNIGHILQKLVDDRAFMASWFVLLFSTVITTITLALQIHPSDLNTQTRYTAFGDVQIYSNPWYHLLPIVLFGLTVFILHTLIAIKIFLTKSNHLARLFLWVSIVIVVVSMIIGLAVLGLASI